MAQLFANNVVSVTVGQTLATATSIQVAQGEKFPSLQGGDYFLATLVGLDGNGNENAWEIVRVIARSGNLLTVGRAEENTTVQTWPAGTRIEMRLTSGSLNRIDGDVSGKLGNTGPQVLNVESMASALIVNQAGSGNYLTLGNGTTQVAVRNTGNVGLGGNATGNVGLLNKLSISGSTTSTGIQTYANVASDVTGSAFGFRTDLGTDNAEFTLGSIGHFYANQSSFGNSSTVTEQVGFRASGGLIGATKNYGFRSEIPAGKDRWNFYASGTADNYFAGNTTFGNGAGVGGVINLRAGVAGTAGAINWTFNSPDVVYGSVSLPWDTRGSLGLVIASVNSYPITLQSGTTPSSTNAVVLKTAGEERIRVENHGGIGVGGIGNSNVGLYLRKPITGATTSYGVALNAVVMPDASLTAVAYSSIVTTTPADFTLTNLVHFNASQSVLGAGSVVTAQHGFRAQSTLIGAKVNYGFRSELPYQADIRDGSRWNFYASGAAPNYFGGRVRIGSTTTISSNLDAFIITDVSSATISAISTNTNTTATRTHIKLGINDVEVGSVGTVSDEMYFGVAGSSKLNIGANTVKPSLDNSLSLGGATNRWSTVYSASGTINTSDAREKTEVRLLSSQEVEAAKLLSKEIGAYRWLSAVQEKGDEAREHIGLTVQRAMEIMESCGLEPFKYGFICYDHWEKQTVDHPAEYESVEIPAVLDEEGQEVESARTEQGELIKAAWTEVIREAGDRYSFRYDELNLFLARGLEARLAVLEAML